MRLEIMDLKEEPNDIDPDLEADDNSWLEDDNLEDYDEDKGSRSGSAQFVSDTEEDMENTSKAVTMKDDILTCAVTSTAQTSIAPNVAPIAPLPSRLSFCLSPQRQNQLDIMIERESNRNR